QKKIGHNRLLLDEQAACVLDGAHWLHRATYWLYLGTGLGVKLPPAAKAVRMTIDGREIPISGTSEADFWFPATTGHRMPKVLLYWRYPSEIESLIEPRLAKPV